MSIFSFLENFTNPKPKQEQNSGLRLWLGTATGKLAEKGLLANLETGEEVVFFRDDILQSFLVVGDPGSGKTSGVIRPLVLQLLDQQAGLVILDGKNDLGPEVLQLAQHLKRQVYRIGVGGLPFNLFDGLTPDQIGGILKQAFEITGAGGGTEGGDYWATQAVVRSKHALGLLKYTPEHYSMIGLQTGEWKLLIQGELRSVSLAA